MNTHTGTRRFFASELEAKLEAALPGNSNPGAIPRAVGILEKLSRVHQDLVLHWVEVAAQSSYDVALNIAFLAPSAVKQLDDKNFEAWVLGALELKDKQGIEHTLNFLRDIDGFIARSQSATTTASFMEIEHRTRLFIQALSGEFIDIKTAAFAVTDTETLYLPNVLTTLPDAAANRRLYKIMATMLWAQTRYGTFGDISDVKTLSAANAHLEEVFEKYTDDEDETERALRWLAALESIRLEGRLTTDFPGLAAEIIEMRGPLSPELASVLPRLYQAEATLEDTVVLLETFMSSGADITPMVHAVSVDPRIMQAIRAQKRTDGKPRLGAKEEEFDPFPAEYDEGDRVGQGKPSDMEPGTSQPIPSGATDAGVRDDEAYAPMKHKTDLFQEPDHKYDEWDFRRGVYKKDWCFLYEVPVKPGDPAYVDEVKHKYRAYIQQIRRQLEMIKGEDKMLARQVDGDELDLDAVVESFIDRKSGGEPTDHLFRRRVRNQRSLAVMFMVDMSGSTKGWVNKAERESLILLCEALELLNDNYAIYGFSGWGHTRCEIYPVKNFNEQYDNEVRARISGIEGKDFTRMGVAIRHLSKLLEAEPARHHLLVTISDGYPDDFGDDYRSNYGIEDTRRALQEAHERGVRSFCVTIDRQGADYLERLYGPARYEVVANAHRLPLRMAEIYRHLTT